MAQVAIEEAKAAKRRQQRRAIRRASGHKAGVRSTDALATADPLVDSVRQTRSGPLELTRAITRSVPDSPSLSPLLQTQDRGGEASSAHQFDDLPLPKWPRQGQRTQRTQWTQRTEGSG